MKKLLSILLCVALLLTLTPSVFSATTYLNTLSDNTWDFSESTVVGDYGVVGNGTALSVAAISADGGLKGTPAMSITRGTDYKNINISFLDHNSSNISAPAVEVKYSFYVTGVDTMVKYTFREGTTDYNVFQCQSGTVSFLGSSVDSYAKDTWYDVEMLIDISQGYGRLKFKANSAESWKTYHKFAGTGDLSGKTITERLSIGLQADEGKGAGTVLYVDNYSQNIAVNVKPAVLEPDDFGAGIDAWSPMNINAGVTAEQGVLNENKVLKIESNPQSTANSSMYRNIQKYVIEKAPVDTKYTFKFKLGGTITGNTIGASLDTDTGDEVFLASFVNGYLNMLGVVGTNSGNQNFQSAFGRIIENELYEAEAVYSPSTSTLRVVVTNGAGKQVSGSTALAGIPSKFAFRNHTAANTSSTAYFDDFESGILKANGPVLTNNELKSGAPDNASLDETAIFTYDRTIDQSSLSEAVVTLNNKTLNKEEYTITSKGNQVFVELKNLEKSTKYTVNVTGVCDIGLTAANEAASVEFTTAATDIIATKPVLNGTVLSTNVTSFYAQGKTLKLIVAVYDEAESMIEAVKVATVTADSRNGETLSYDFSEILPAAAGKKVKGFVWSGFDSMMPYAEAYK